MAHGLLINLSVYFSLTQELTGMHKAANPSWAIEFDTVFERRRFNYSAHIPERRKDQYSTHDRFGTQPGPNDRTIFRLGLQRKIILFKGQSGDVEIHVTPRNVTGDKTII